MEEFIIEILFANLLQITFSKQIFWTSMSYHVEVSTHL